MGLFVFDMIVCQVSYSSSYGYPIGSNLVTETVRRQCGCFGCACQPFGGSEVIGGFYQRKIISSDADEAKEIDIPSSTNGSNICLTTATLVQIHISSRLLKIGCCAMVVPL